MLSHKPTENTTKMLLPLLAGSQGEMEEEIRIEPQWWKHNVVMDEWANGRFNLRDKEQKHLQKTSIFLPKNNKHLPYDPLYPLNQRISNDCINVPQLVTRL